MKFLIASDIHGSAYYCEQLLQAFEREQAARLLLLGDILYHGPRNDLPRDYAPKKVIAMLNGMADTILCVVYATHGHQFNTKTPPPLRQGDVLLHGHTHIPAWEPFGRENLYLNPGSVSIPKNDTAHGYMTLENGVFTWKTLSGEPYHEWKMEN